MHLFVMNSDGTDQHPLEPEAETFGWAPAWSPVADRDEIVFVSDRDGDSEIFLLQLATQAVTQLLPELYLHGLSQGDFELALRGLLGDGAPLSPASIGRQPLLYCHTETSLREVHCDNATVVLSETETIISLETRTCAPNSILPS